MSQGSHTAAGHQSQHTTNAPLIVAMGLALLLIGLSVAQGGGQRAYWAVFGLGLLVFLFGFAKWVQEYLVSAPEDHYPIEHEPFASVTPRKFGTWVFLLTEMMVFATLFTTYLRYRLAAGDDWVSSARLVQESVRSFLPGVINSMLMVFSSLTLVLGLQAIKRGERQRMVRMLTLTFLMGLAFLLIKAFEWYELIHGDFSHIDAKYAQGFWLTTSMEGSTFYVTTGTHGAHVFGGLVALLFLIKKGSKGGFTKANHNTIEYFGLYWHFVDLMWLFVFAAFYLL